MSDEISNLEDWYKNGPDNIGRDLLQPCLKHCVTWRRGTLGFSSSALKAWAGSFVNIVENVEKIEILADISHVNINDKKLMLALEHTTTPEEKRKALFIYGENIILKALQADRSNDSHKYTWTLLHYLLASEKLEIRFASNKISEGDRNLYHPKGGYFTFPDGEAVAHDGSFNESESGHQYNNETVHVFHKSKEEKRFWRVADSVNEDWNGTAYVEVYKLSRKTLNKIKENAPDKYPLPPPRKPVGPDVIKPSQEEVVRKNFPIIPTRLWGEEFKLRKHQEEAMRKWIDQNGLGLLWHATGSGKTITSLYTLSRIALEGDGNKVISIIHVPFTPLADQWVDELLKFNLSAIKCYGPSAIWTTKLNLELEKFQQATSPFVMPLVVIDKTFFMEPFQNVLHQIEQKYKNKLFYICDECHRFAKKDKTKKLPEAIYKMGLSGTPFNTDDGSAVGDQELKSYFGDVCDKYEIAEALRDDVLTPYDYHPVECYLNEDELIEVKEWEKKIAQGGWDENGEPNEGSSIASGGRNRLLAKVEDKFRKFTNIINKPDVRNYKEQTLFFAGDGSTEIDIEKDQNSHSENISLKVLEKFGRILANHNWNWSRFTSDESPSERKEILSQFSQGIIDAVLAIRILDEGIDIPGVKTAFLLASTSNKRQFVQRRGRILRKAEGKTKAVIYDFIVLPPEGVNCGFVNREINRLVVIGRDSSNKSNIQDIVKSIISRYNIRDENLEEAKLFINEV